MGTWNLDILYKGFDDPAFASDMETMTELIEKTAQLAEGCDTLDAKTLLRSYVQVSEELTELVSKLAIFANLRYSANTRDMDAASSLGRIQGALSATAAPDTRVRAKIAAIDDLSGVITEAGLEEYRYFLENIKKDARYLLSEGEETVFAKMNISGASAWSDLQSALTSGLKVDYNGEQITLSEVRNLAYSPDASVRRAAYEAELAAYDKIAESVAFALNSIKLQVLSECELRGYASPLDKSLYTSRMTRETLDALISAMEEYMPAFRRYLKAKAKALGHADGLPFYDLFAPMGKCDKTFTKDTAKDYLLGIFATFDSELHDMVKCAFEESWIDFYPREGKVGGAFDCGVPSAKQSRVLTNFDGSFSDVVTLAHELGHSFHDRQVFSHSVINQEYSMPVAETASTFNEVLVMEKAISGTEDRQEKLALIESQLSDACQIICDIYSRYTFETSVFENRPQEFMPASRMCELMLSAQDKSYGDGLDSRFKHPYMWLCKGHYYSGSLSFYNFPYAFGGLLARGLYAKYKKEGASFIPTYKAFLHATSVMSVEDCARMAGIDLTDRAFWCEGLATIAEEIDLFCELIK